MTIVIICETCGNENEEDADFCWFDGEPLEWSGKRVVKETGEAVGGSGAPDDNVYDVGPLYQAEPEAAPAPAAEPVAAAPPPPVPVEAPAVERPVRASGPGEGVSGEPGGSPARGVPEPEPVVAAEPPPPAPEPVPEPVAAAEPAVAPPPEEEHEKPAEQLLKKLPGRRRKEAAQPAAAAAAPPTPAPPVPTPPPAPARGAAPPPPPSAPPTGPPSRIVPPPPTPAAPPAAPAGANGGSSATTPPAEAAPPAAADSAPAAPVKLTRAEEEKARKKAEAEEAARLAAEEEARRKEAAKRLYIPVKTEPEPVAAPPPLPPPVPVAEPVKLTWWQRFVAWVKRLFTGTPSEAAPAQAAAQTAAPAAPAAATAPPAAAAAAAVTQSTATAPPAPQAPTAQTPGAEVPTARPPGKEKQTGPKVPSALKPTKEFERKAKTEKKAEEEPQYEPGDLICTQCGTGNKPTNKFCKRCGTSLAEAPTAEKPSWWQRMLTKLHLRRRRQFEAGFRKRRKDGGGGGKSFFWRLQNLSFRSVGLIFLAVAMVGVYASWGPVFKTRYDTYYNYFHDKFLPSFTPETPVAATASSTLDNAHRPKNVTDTDFNTAWISKPTRTHGVLQTVTVYFDAPVKFGIVGFKNGAQTKQGDIIPKYARAKTVRIFFFGKNGKLLKGTSEKCGLSDTPGLQHCHSVNLKGVKKIQVRILAVYGKTGRTQSVALSAVETQRRK